MLLLHQTGAVRVGEVVRYSLTYVPSLDRILPPPTHLHVKIKNTSAIPLRAAYLHGPYTLYVSCYPSTFDPNQKFTASEEDGDPDYEPQLKAGGQWTSKLKVPERIRQAGWSGEAGENEPKKSFTWIIEVASQVLFSTSAAVHYELLVGRDEKSVSLSFTGVVSSHGVPGRLEDHQQGRSKGNAQPKGVFTKAVKLRVDDTASLWSTPAFPEDDKRTAENTDIQPQHEEERVGSEKKPRKRRKKIHLVIITHGLHSNLGADMLFLKESIDTAAKQAREVKKQKKKEFREQKAKDQYNFGREAVDIRSKSVPDVTVAPTHSVHEDESTRTSDEEDDDEQVIVRGFNGNAIKTERGIQFLGKRLAKYVLSLTYPDQPYLPVKSTITQSITRTFTGTPKSTLQNGRQPSHKHSSIAKDEKHAQHKLPYKIIRISFIGHSLGGLIQTYAIAYIQKHSPEFFDKIEPINFVALASPFLGLSNENPMYVRFALDFGLVGRTGQDLGLTWRPPTIARNGWGAVVSGFSSDKDARQPDPQAKPLLRILPTGPAHIALKRFRNRSVYSNVVNDGIVPLRTSCLLFLDWRGLGRVEKARRENGLVGTMVNWGLNEITGTNASTPRRGLFDDLFSDSGDENKSVVKHSPDPGSAVPQAEAGSGLDKDSYDADDGGNSSRGHASRSGSISDGHSDGASIWSTLTNFFRPQAGTHKAPSAKQRKIYERGQTLDMEGSGQEAAEPNAKDNTSLENHRKLLVRGSSLYTNSSEGENMDAPPRTTVFESAGDLLNPPLPPKEFLLDPEVRPRTIFHDRVYHPEDIPPPPTKRQKTFMRSRPNTAQPSAPSVTNNEIPRPATSTVDQGGIRIEEKIARAYHKDMSWRKVLVRLEPDAHNNIIVRRMFANAYGWPVVKHLCDTHFAYTTAAETRDEDEDTVERAKAQDTAAGKEGEEVVNQTETPEDASIGRPQRSATMDDISDKDDDEIETLHRRQHNMRAVMPKPPQKQKPDTKVRSKRTPSELRESTDQVSDLVSLVSAQGEPSQSYSSMHSGTAALNSLPRKDSAKWSDRFFESSEDEYDDDDTTDLNLEWQKAFDRGELSKKYGASPQSTRSGKNSYRVRGKQGSDPVFTDAGEAGKVFDEPEEISRRNSRQVSVASDLSDGQILAVRGLGLVRGDTESRDIGVAEQVAKVRTQGEDTRTRPALGDPKKTLD